MFAKWLKREKLPAESIAPVSADKAKQMILGGKAPAGLRVEGALDLAGSDRLTSLPAGLSAGSINLSGCTALQSLPSGLRARTIRLNGCRSLSQLPGDLRCDVLEAQGLPVRALPSDLHVTYRLDLSDCVELETLPEGLSVGTLVLRNCRSLETLPEGLNVFFLDIAGCVGLRRWPREARMRYGHLHAAGCTEIRSLPDWLNNVAQLDLNGCTSILELPEGLSITSWLDLANTGIDKLPESLRHVPLRWRGVRIDERIAFHPETITVDEILQEPNVERRRVLMERMGYEAFLSLAEAQILDRDEDPGGERRLLKVRMPGDEDLVCLAVYCPSTGRQYMLRVPPTLRTCRAAAAWIAGFDNVDDYRPIAET